MLFKSFTDFVILCNHTRDQTSDSEAALQASMSNEQEKKKVLAALKIADRTSKAIDRITNVWLDSVRGEEAIACIRHASTSYRATPNPLPNDTNKHCCFSHNSAKLFSVVFTFSSDGEVKLSRAFVVCELWLRAIQALLVLSRRRDYIKLAEQSGDAEADNSDLRKELMFYFNNAFAFVKTMINTIY